jgi:hypothetical protein
MACIWTWATATRTRVVEVPVVSYTSMRRREATTSCPRNSDGSPNPSTLYCLKLRRESRLDGFPPPLSIHPFGTVKGHSRDLCCCQLQCSWCENPSWEASPRSCVGIRVSPPVAMMHCLSGRVALFALVWASNEASISDVAHGGLRA